MTAKAENKTGEFLLLPCTSMSTESNLTGSWRFMKPRYEEKTAPCSAACPAGEDIGRIEMLVTQGLFKEAWDTILRENPFPAVCGRVCYHPCENNCNRGEFDEAIAIHSLERFLADTASKNEFKPSIDLRPARDERIAIIGAGPGGLATAYFLALLGYPCDVFESTSATGGVLRWGIPLYRLPLAVLEGEIARIEALGVTIHTGRHITSDFLKTAHERYNAVFVGCGHSKSRKLGIDGEDLDGLEEGIRFLEKIRRGDLPAVEGTVAVIGGGNTAVDVARSAVRLGGKSVLVYRRRREDMPAFEHEVEMALEEGVELRQLLAPVEVKQTENGYTLVVRSMKVVGEDEDGRAAIEPVGETTEELTVQKVFKAIGEEPAENWYNPPLKRQNVMRLNHSVLVHEPRRPAVVFGGDLTSRIKSVVHAVASGKEAAIALDVLFREGADAIRARLKSCAVGGGAALSMEAYMDGLRKNRSHHTVRYEEINTDYFQTTSRVTQPRLLIGERIGSFKEIDLKISANLAIKEAERCFNCGLCNQCDNCYLFCPDLAVCRDESSQGRHINYDYCKGCGLCVVECPRNAMILEEEGQ